MKSKRFRRFLAKKIDSHPVAKKQAKKMQKELLYVVNYFNKIAQKVKKREQFFTSLKSQIGV